MRMEQMYQEVILDHYKHPHGRGLREPICGDEVTLRVHIDDAGIVADVSYDGQGCSISQAATSVLTDQVVGLPVERALTVVDAFSAMVGSRGSVDGDVDVIGDGIAFAGVSKYPARVKCALLGWMAFKDAVVRIVEAPAGSTGRKNDEESARSGGQWT